MTNVGQAAMTDVLSAVAGELVLAQTPVRGSMELSASCWTQLPPTSGAR